MKIPGIACSSGSGIIFSGNHLMVRQAHQQTSKTIKPNLTGFKNRLIKKKLRKKRDPNSNPEGVESE
jgi:ribosomal protein S17E